MPDIIGQTIAGILNDYKDDKITIAKAVNEIKEIYEVMYEE